MENFEESMKKLFDRARQKKSLENKLRLLEISAKDICLNIDQPIYGIATFLARALAAFYGNVECTIEREHHGSISFNAVTDGCPDLLNLIDGIEPQAVINVTFAAKNPNPEYFIKPIAELVRFYFEADCYHMVYYVQNAEKLRFTFNYSENISSKYILLMRNELSTSIYARLEAMIDQ
ncbi:hypothetical protein [Chitinophaga rhizosphaerae]|uniref:hypothetical protein n=1 Tax=Chitinophaga rhizosphaerae TaxID=1864947 RepID=UPI000F813101|nr:hypothetical protein [Chitinophaga rhizosphaerae]